MGAKKKKENLLLSRVFICAFFLHLQHEISPLFLYFSSSSYTTHGKEQKKRSKVRCNGCINVRIMRKKNFLLSA